MWELHNKEAWTQKDWCIWAVVLEKTLESPLGGKEIQPVHPKGNQSWIFIWSTDIDTEAPIVWPPDVKSRVIEKDLILGKIEGRRRRGQQRMGGWLVSLTRWTWVWASSWSWRWTGKPGMLQSMGSHSVRHDWATELTECFQGPSIFLQWWDFLLYIAENIQLCKYLIVLVAQLCLILCHPMGYSLPGSSVYEIL